MPEGTHGAHGEETPRESSPYVEPGPCHLGDARLGDREPVDQRRGAAPARHRRPGSTSPRSATSTSRSPACSACG
ncbi:hypothetical protein [Nocardioides convexus]|uniref:hypothetical protein n=1 Tax=Nocardioides convexus TaxID=2712224 RepID=UPI00241896CC|nr:hypothetical protein [Nocardioides convexus]